MAASKRQEEKDQTRATPVVRRRSLSPKGRLQGQAQESCDLVSIPEAAARLGWRRSELAELLSKRKARTLVIGSKGWLVDLQLLASAADEGAAGVLESGIEVIERGSFL